MVIIIAQIIGFFGTLFFVLSFRQEKRYKIILFEAIANFIEAIHFLLLGAVSGALGTGAEGLSFLLIELKDKNRSKFINYLIILTIFLLFSFSSYFVLQTKESLFIKILPIMGSFIIIFGSFNHNKQIIRLSGMICFFLWLIYSIYVKSYAGILTESITMISTFLTMFTKRHRPNKYHYRRKKINNLVNHNYKR